MTESAHSKHPPEPEAVARAKAAVGAERFEEAITLLETHLSEHPQDARAWHRLVGARIGAKQLIQAQADAEHSIALDPELPAAHLMLAIALLIQAQSTTDPAGRTRLCTESETAAARSLELNPPIEPATPRTGTEPRPARSATHADENEPPVGVAARTDGDPSVVGEVEVRADDDVLLVGGAEARADDEAARAAAGAVRADAHAVRAEVLRMLGRSQESLAAARAALAINPAQRSARRMVGSRRSRWLMIARAAAVPGLLVFGFLTLLVSDTDQGPVFVACAVLALLVWIVGSFAHPARATRLDGSQPPARADLVITVVASFAFVAVPLLLTGTRTDTTVVILLLTAPLSALAAYTLHRNQTGLATTASRRR